MLNLGIFEDVLKDSKYVVYVKDAEDNFLYLNNAACLATKANLENIRSKTFKEGSKEKIIYDALFANEVEILQTNKAISKVYYLEKNNNPFVPATSYYFTKQPLTLEDGSRVILGFGIDITETLIENKALKFFKVVLDTIKDGFIITETEHPFKIIYANQAFLKLTGFDSLEHVTGKGPTEVLETFTEDAKERERMNMALAKKQPVEIVLRNSNVKGEVFRTHLNVMPVYYSDKKEPDFFISIQRDITENFEKNQLVRKQQSRLKAVFDSVTSYLWLLDRDKTLINANKSALQEGGYADKDKIIGKLFSSCRWWKYQVNTADLVEECLDKALNEGKPASITIDLLDLKDRPRRIQLTATPSRSSKGNINYLVVEGVDVTELTRTALHYKTLAASEYDVSEGELESIAKSVETGSGELERVVKMESTVAIIAPQVKELNTLINDPNNGLVVKLNKIDESITKLVNRTESTESVISFLDFIKKLPKLWKQPIVKIAVYMILGASLFNTLSSTLFKVVDFTNIIENVIQSDN